MDPAAFDLNREGELKFVREGAISTPHELGLVDRRPGDGRHSNVDAHASVKAHCLTFRLPEALDC